MANTESDLDRFARVQGDKIVEFPVYRLHIKNRALPMIWFIQATEMEKPELPAFSCYEEHVDLQAGKVIVSYTTRPYTLEELLHQLTIGTDRELDLGEPAELPKFSEIDPLMVQRIYSLASDYITAKLVAFAATRGYGNEKVDAFTSLASYKDSAVDKFNSEALRGLSLRDQAWANLLTYFQKVSMELLPIPTAISDIDALIPELTWE